MAKSNKPIVWGTFAAGGTVAAFCTPVLIVLTLLAATGHTPDILTYDRLRGFAGHWFGKLVLFGVLSLSLWGAAHRLRITFYDFGVRADILVASLCYLVAAIGTLACAVFLLSI